MHLRVDKAASLCIKPRVLATDGRVYALWPSGAMATSLPLTKDYRIIIIIVSEYVFGIQKLDVKTPHPL